MATLTGRPFSLFSGGPFDQLIRKLHLLRPSGALRISWIVLVAWVPLILGALVRVAAGRAVDPMVLDISLHVRFLVALPLVLISSQLLEAQCSGAVRVLYDAKLAERESLDAILERAEHWRSSAWIELVLAVAALAFGQLGLWGVTGPTGLFHGIDRHLDWSFSRIWYGTISLPLFLFLIVRWMWRWVLWIYVILRVSRLPLAATAAHPDHAAGLSCFTWPLTGYTWYVGAFASVLAGAWGTQLIQHRMTVPSLGPSVLILIVVAIIVGYGPLLVFTPQLYAIKRRDLKNNTVLGFEYMRGFDAKWVRGKPSGEHLLGSQDIQALNDFGGAFQMVLTMRLTVFPPMRIRNIAIAVVLPMTPLLATVIPLETVIPRLASAFFGAP